MFSPARMEKVNNPFLSRFASVLVLGVCRILFCAFIVLTFSEAHSFRPRDYYLGLGSYYQNNFGKISKERTGKTSSLGQNYIPLYFAYEYGVSSEWLGNVQFLATPLARRASADAAEIRFYNLSSYVGKNIYGSGSSFYSWGLGLGLFRYELKGKDGTTVLNNGSSTSTFFLPGRSVASTYFSTNLMAAMNVDRVRAAFEVFIPNTFDNKKRSYDILFSLGYRLNGN